MNAYRSSRLTGVDEEEFSTVRELLAESVKSLGGYYNPVFKTKDKTQRLAALHELLSDDKLNIEKAQERCIRVDKIQQVTVNEKSSVRDLNLAVLMTHPDFLGPVYYHRGNALMVAKRWSQAITDFSLAIQSSYEGTQEYRIHHKIGQCHVKRKQFTKAVESFRQALDLVEKGNIPHKTREEFRKILLDCVAKFSSKPDEVRKKVEDYKVEQPSPVDGRVSDQVEVIETIGKGRNAFAKVNIKVGSILAAVEAAGAHLNPDDANQIMQFCLHCLLGVEVPYPCPSCPRVVFCSPECEQIACGSYHKYQCQLDLYNIRLNDSKDGCTIFQSLSVIGSQPLSFWTQNQSAFLEPPGNSDWPVPVNSDREKMALLFQMATNEGDVPADTHARHALVTLLLIRALRKTKYFEDSDLPTPCGSLTKEELILGQLIYRLRLIQDMNSHPIWGVSGNTKDNNIARDHIGAGMYTGIGSYFNSDCNPNTIRVNCGKTMLLIASKNIKKGEEVMDNYCIHFSELPLQSRRPWIQEHFLFDCTCDACEENWPTYRNLPQERPSQKVSDKLVALEMENMTAMEQGNIDKAIAAIQQEISLIQGACREPHQLPVTIRNTFQFCWWKKIIQQLQMRNV